MPVLYKKKIKNILNQKNLFFRLILKTNCRNIFVRPVTLNWRASTSLHILQIKPRTVLNPGSRNLKMKNFLKMRKQRLRRQPTRISHSGTSQLKRNSIMRTSSRRFSFRLLRIRGIRDMLITLH